MLAQYLGVSFQAVNKWENGAALPDVAAIPAIALFFGVSTDQLFDIHLLYIDRQVSEICDEAVRFRNTDLARGEYNLAKLALEQIPEIYFTRLQFQALLLKGDDMYVPRLGAKGAGGGDAGGYAPAPCRLLQGKE